MLIFKSLKINIGKKKNVLGLHIDQTRSLQLSLQVISSLVLIVTKKMELLKAFNKILWVAL